MPVLGNPNKSSSLRTKRVFMDYFNSLPEEITLDILTRLPAETVLECKLVCTNWRNLVSNHPSFSKMHLHHLNHPSDSTDGDDSDKLDFIARTCDFIRDNEIFYYFEYNQNHDDESTHPIHRIARINFTSSFEVTKVVGSCNVLICLATYNQPFVCVCNPITREYVMLPKLMRDCCDTGTDEYSYGETSFGYVSSTNQYKVLGIYKSLTNVEVHMYTLGSGCGWRNIGKFNFESIHFFDDAGIFANGALYWPDVELETIVTFDLAEETFSKNLSPPPLPQDNVFRDYKIGVLNGFLYFSTILDYKGDGLEDIWLLRKKNDNHDKKEQNDCQSFGWTKELRAEDNGLLAVTKSDGLITHSHFHLHIFNTKTSTSKNLAMFEDSLYQVSPHRNTLVSLKELREEDIKIMESLKIEERVNPVYVRL